MDQGSASGGTRTGSRSARHRRGAAAASTAPDAPSDAALLAAVRAGDAAAYETVYRRHVQAAHRLAVVLARNKAEADDLVSEAFARVLTAVKGGGGPESAVRAYLLTTLRRVHVDRGRSGARLESVEDVAEYERPAPAEDDPVVRGLDRAYAARAFAGLPERWQAVLWHTEVEGESAAKVAPLLGLNPNAVSAIAYRARERLRQLYLQEHLAAAEGKDCRWCTERLGAYVRDKLGARESGRVRTHLDECDSCRVVYLDLVEVNAGFRSILAPIVLGGAAAPYLAAAGHGALAGVLPFWRWWQRITRNPTAAAAAVVVLCLMLGATAWATVGHHQLLGLGGGASTGQQAGGGGGGAGGGGGTGGGGAGSSAQPTAKSSPKTTKAKKPSHQATPSTAPTSTAPSHPPASHPPASRPTRSSTPAQSHPAPKPTPSSSQPTHSSPPPTHTKPPPEPPPPSPTTTRPTPKPPQTPPPIRPPQPGDPGHRHRIGICVRLPFLRFCIGDESPRR